MQEKGKRLGNRQKRQCNLHLNGGIAQRSSEREFPELLVVWAYQQKKLVFGRGIFFPRVSAKKNWCFFFVFWGCFCAFGGCFCSFWGCFCAFGVFLFFARQRNYFLGSFFSKAYHTETGNSCSDGAALFPARLLFFRWSRVTGVTSKGKAEFRWERNSAEFRLKVKQSETYSGQPSAAGPEAPCFTRYY